jgi:hypothetical protein
MNGYRTPPRDIDLRQQPEPMQLGRDRPPFVGGKAGDERRRIGHVDGLRGLRLVRRQALLARVAPQQFQLRRHRSLSGFHV